MDILSLELSRTAPFPGGTGDASPLARLQRRWHSRADRARSVGSGNPGPIRSATAVRDRRGVLLGWTAAQILLGLGLLALVTVYLEIDPAINPGLDGTALAGPTGGVLLWTVFGLLGSVRSVSDRGRQVHFTFNMPFVGAAMVLGGPAAGAWVAFLSTIERRELESQPWYGIVANHSLMVIAAVSGGIAFALVDAALLAATGDPGLALFIAIVVGGIVMELGANVLASITFMLRDRMTAGGVLGLLVEDFGRVTLLEIGLIWILAVAFTEIGWWAPLVVGIIVLVVSADGSEEPPDPLTGLMRRTTWDARLDRKIGFMRRGILDGGTLMFLDLNGFHLVNNEHGHAVGDEALVAVADRLRKLCPRREDLVARLMGDELAVFFAGLTDPEVAMRKAEEIVESICRPIATSVGSVEIGVAVGVQVTNAWGGVPSGATLLRWAENAMYFAKIEGGARGGAHLYSADDGSPFEGDRRHIRQ